MYGDYSRGHEPDRKRGRDYRRVLLQQGRPVLDSDVASLVDALLDEVQTSTRGLSCSAASPDLGYLVTPGRLLAVFAEAADDITVTTGTPDAWIDYRVRYLHRYPALHLAGGEGALARVTLPLLQAFDPDGASTRLALWAQVEEAVTIRINGIPVALTPDSPVRPERVEFDAADVALDPLEIEVPGGGEVWLLLLEQAEVAGSEPAFWIAPGSYHVDGLIADARGGGAFPDVSFPESAGFPWTDSPPPDPPLDGLLAPPGLPIGARLVAYLELHERHITAVEDPGIREEALGTGDTCARTELVAQVKLATLTGSLPAGDAAAALVRAAYDSVEVSGGELVVAVPQSTPTTDPCALPDLAGYSGSDNRLYRVEVHRGGPLSQVRLKWSRDNGSELFAAGLDDDDNLVFDAGTPLARGDLVEVLSHVVDLGDDTLGLVSAGGFDPPERAVGQLGRLEPVAGPGTSDDLLFRLVDPDDVSNAVTLDKQRYGNVDDAVLKVRRWHGIVDPTLVAGADPASAGPHVLEDGITVELSSTGAYRPGQWWQYEARARGENDNGPWRPQPHGPERRFAPLALLRYHGAAQPLELLAWLDERFSQPCDLDADDVDFAGRRVGSSSDTVQEALEELFERPPEIVDASCGEIVVRPENDLQTVFDSIPEWADARLCIHPGTWTVQETVNIENKGNLIISGAGMVTTRLVGPTVDTVLRFDNCGSVQLRDLSVEGGQAAETSDGLVGSVSVNHSLLVDLQRVMATCGHSTSRRMSAVNVHGMACFILTGVRIRDCIIRAGNAQVGVLVVGARTADIEGNDVVTDETYMPLVDAVEDPQVAARIGRRVIDDARFGETDEFPNDFLLGGDNVSEQEPVDGRARVLVFLEEWGNQFIAFTTTTLLGSQRWRELLVANPLPGTWDPAVAPDDWITAGLRRLRVRLARAMFGVDDLNLTQDTRDRLVQAGAGLAGEDNEIAAGDQGIVVAGRGTIWGTSLENPNPHPDVRIVGNRVRGFVQGIHVATSRELPSGSFAPSPPRLAYRVTIADNTVQLRAPSLARGRHGIFVGNAYHVRISGNTVQLVAPEDAPHAPIDAIRTIGWFGPLIQITQNSCFGTTNGVVASARNPDLATVTGWAWAVAHNAHWNGGGGVAERINWHYWRRVGAPGQPAFRNGWTNFKPTGDRPAGFYKDPWGFVHLQGVIRGGGVGTTIFTLPPDHRPDFPGPDRNAHFPVVSNGAFGAVYVLTDGSVFLGTGSAAWVDLGTIQFRAG